MSTTSAKCDMDGNIAGSYHETMKILEQTMTSACATLLCNVLRYAVVDGAISG